MAPTAAAVRRTVFIVLLCLVAVGLGTGSVAAQEEFEPNDDFENATELEPGTYTGLNITEGDVDFYAVELAQGEQLSASIAFSNDRGDLDFLLVGPDRALREASTSTNDTETVSYIADTSGTYYLIVGGFANATGPYDLTMATANGSAAPGDRFEPNDDLGNATALDSGDYPDLNITTGDLDFYTLDVPRGESLSASITFSHDRGDLDLFVLDANGTIVARSISETDDENVSLVVGTDGPYYLVVAGFENATGPYDLSVAAGPGEDGPGGDDRFEPNDGFENATAVTPGDYPGLNVTAGDEDFFAVDLAPGETLSASIAFSNERGDLDAALLGPNGTLLETSTGIGDTENISYTAVEAGTHYLVVYGFDNATGPYDLALSATTGGAVDGDRFEPNDDRANATRIGPRPYGGVNVTPGDQDFYAFAAQRGDFLTAEIAFSNARGDLDFALLGPDGSVLTDSTGVDDTERVTYTIPENGTYYLLVYGFANATGPYELSLSLTHEGQPPTEEREPNDDFESATPIEPGSYPDRTITEGDVDFYALDLAAAQTLSASIAFSNERGDLDVALVGPDRTVRQSSTTQNDGERVSYVAPDGGTYYLVIYPFANATGSYDLTVETTGGAPSTGPTPAPVSSDRFEPNDDFGNATALAPGDYPGLNITEEDVDFFAVDLGSEQTLSASIAFSDDRGDLDFALVAPDGTVLQVSDGTADTESLSYVVSEDGTYYLAVYGYQGATGPYNLSVSVGG